MKKLFGVFKKRWVISLLGLVALCLIIYLGGPFLAIAGREPLAPVLSRWIVIAIVVVVWVALLLWKHRRELVANGLLLAGLAARAEQTGPSPSEQVSREELEKLQARMERALAILKNTRLKGQFGSQYVYQLPWYIMIGAPGSGKTTALLHSGLKFPLAKQLGGEEIRGIGGTRNCDWLFTDEAVLLDTAGRYLTQDSDREADSAAWMGFLGLLKRYRRRRPINGVIVAVSLPDMLRQSSSERQRNADETRQRLKELHDTFGIRFPVYVLFTKCDLLGGFVEFFSDLGRDERAQVLGTTFPLPDEPSQADVLTSFPADFQALEQRLNGRTLERLQQERDPFRRALIYSFPQQFSAARDATIEYLSEIFQATQRGERALLRGVYFTSGTQEGAPIDRVMTSLARSIGLRHSPLPAHAGAGKSYFITRLLRDVIFAEQELAGANLKLERRRAWLQTAAYAGIVALTVLVIAGWFVSYGSNRAKVAEVSRRVAELKPQIAAVTANQTSLEALLPILDAVRDLPWGYAERNKSVPLSQRLGLFQGDMLGSGAREAYYRLLEGVLLPAVARQMEDRLGQGGGDYGYRFGLLKAYLMLSSTEHPFDLKFIKQFAQRDWEEHSGMVPPEQRAQLAQHTAALFENASLQQLFDANQALIAQTRQRLASMPREQRLYERLKTLPEARALEHFSPTKADPKARWVFLRKSGVPIDQGVPGLFTRKGYALFKREVDGILQTELTDAWVLGESTDSAKAASSTIQSGIRTLYFGEYVNRWRGLLDDFIIISFSSPADAAVKLQLLSRDDSPLRNLLKAASDETTLVEPVPPETQSELTTKAKEFIGGAAPVELPTPVDKEFEYLHRMVKGEGGKAPIDNTLALLDEVYRYMQAVDDMIKRGQPIPPGGDEVVARVKAESPLHPPPTGTVLQAVAREAGSVVQRGNYAKFNADWTSSVVPLCRQAVLGRYPLNKNSAEDATPGDFGQLLGNGGKVDTFFQSVRAYIDTGKKPWRTRSMGQASIPISADALTSMQYAEDIRLVFFRPGEQLPSLGFDVMPVKMDKTIGVFTLDVDGTVLRYDHGPRRNVAMKWPGTGGTDRARVEISPARPGGKSAITKTGPWALFKLLDEADIEPTEDGHRYLLTFEIDGRRTTVELRTSSVFNPFTLAALKNFRCPERL